MAERKWKKISTWMAAWVMAVVFAVSGAQTAFAATSYVNGVSITLDVTPTVGESLPDLDVGYNSDNCEVSIPNNDKYDIVSAKWSSTKNDVKIGGTYTMKVTLKTLNNYRFSILFDVFIILFSGILQFIKHHIIQHFYVRALHSR